MSSNRDVLVSWVNQPLTVLPLDDLLRGRTPTLDHVPLLSAVGSAGAAVTARPGTMATDWGSGALDAVWQLAVGRARRCHQYPPDSV